MTMPHKMNMMILIHFQIGQFEKIKVSPFSCLLLGFTCLNLLSNVSKMWLANPLITILTKNERLCMYLFNVIYMWHVPYVFTIRKPCEKRTAIVFPLRFFWLPSSIVTKQLHFYLFFIFFAIVIFNFFGACNIHLEMYFKTFPMVYYKLPYFKHLS